MSINSFSVVSSQQTANHVEVVGNLAGTATGGAYKIPLRIVYPTGTSPLLHRAICEPWNSVFFQSFYKYNPNILEISLLLMGPTFLVDTLGYTVVTHEWYKYTVDTILTMGSSGNHFTPPGMLAIPFDATWTIAAGTDSFTIMRDVSEFSRNPAGFGSFGALPAPQTCAKAFGYGYSQTGMMLRGFAGTSQNTGLGGSFPNGLVYEGILACAAGCYTRTLTTNAAQGYFTAPQLVGATPSDQGPFINLSTESEPYIFDGALARVAVDVAHYRNYEIAGVPHFFGFSNYDWNDPRPVVRAMMENLRAKVDSGTALPASTNLEGSVATRSAPLFSSTPAAITGFALGVPMQSVYVGVLNSEDGNLKGGIRLPHLRTTLSNGSAVGAPLANYRANYFQSLSLKNNLPATAPLDAATPQPAMGTEYFQMISGMQQPYEPALIAQRYRNIGEYTALVASAADYALSNKWILQADRDGYVAAAAAMTYQGLLDTGARRTVYPTPVLF